MQERKLEVVDNRYLFTVVDKEQYFKQEKSYSKEEMIDIYKSVKNQLYQIGQAIGDTKRALDVNIAEDTPELREFMEQLNKVNKLMEKEKLEKQLEQQKQQQDMFELQLKEIKNAIPEIERSKK